MFVSEDTGVDEAEIVMTEYCGFALVLKTGRRMISGNTVFRACATHP